LSNSHFPEIIFVCFLAALVAVPYIFLRRWEDRRNKEKARARAERRRQEEEAGVPPSPADYHYAITFDAQNVTVTDLRSRKSETVSIAWSDVCSATAFKRDLWSVDCICLHFGRADDTGVEVDEDMAGWNRLMNALPTLLPGCTPHSEWFCVVAYPAFAANPTKIYSVSQKDAG